MKNSSTLIYWVQYIYGKAIENRHDKNNVTSKPLSWSIKNKKNNENTTSLTSTQEKKIIK